MADARRGLICHANMAAADPASELQSGRLSVQQCDRWRKQQQAAAAALQRWSLARVLMQMFCFMFRLKKIRKQPGEGLLGGYRHRRVELRQPTPACLSANALKRQHATRGNL